VNPDIFRFDDLVAGVEEESPDDLLKNDALGLSVSN
jgi:hypothetical protein